MSRTPAVRARSPILLALAAAALAACTSKEPPPACPRVAVVGAAASLTRFAAGPGRDLTDVDFQASIVDLVSACRDTGTRGAQPMAKLMVAPVLVIDRGPANTSRQASFAYFVSVVDPDQRILNKQTFPVAVGFPGNRNRVVLRDDDPPIFVDVPNPQGAGAREYEILVGIQLDQSEIDYNLRQAGGGTPAGALIREPGPIE